MTHEEIIKAIGALVDHDASYVGNTIVIQCDSHGDAIGRMLRARIAYDVLKNGNPLSEAVKQGEELVALLSGK